MFVVLSFTIGIIYSWIAFLFAIAPEMLMFLSGVFFPVETMPVKYRLVRHWRAGVMGNNCIRSGFLTIQDEIDYGNAVTSFNRLTNRPSTANG